MKLKVIVGFRKNQYYTIDADEAHKAYYIFLNPEKRTVFKNGVALIGQSIQGIEPDYNATMGWNPEHTLDNDDWTQLRKSGIDRKFRELLNYASEVAKTGQNLNLPLSEIKLLNNGK